MSSTSSSSVRSFEVRKANDGTDKRREWTSHFFVINVKFNPRGGGKLFIMQLGISLRCTWESGNLFFCQGHNTTRTKGITIPFRGTLRGRYFIRLKTSKKEENFAIKWRWMTLIAWWCVWLYVAVHQLITMPRRKTIIFMYKMSFSFYWCDSSSAHYSHTHTHTHDNRWFN